LKFQINSNINLVFANKKLFAIAIIRNKTKNKSVLAVSTIIKLLKQSKLYEVMYSILLSLSFATLDTEKISHFEVKNKIDNDTNSYAKLRSAVLLLSSLPRISEICDPTSALLSRYLYLIPPHYRLLSHSSFSSVLPLSTRLPIKHYFFFFFFTVARAPTISKTTFFNLPITSFNRLRSERWRNK